MSENKQNLAEFLKNKRQEKKITLAKLGELTKIQAYHLEALEAGQFEKLPPLVYRTGMFERLAKFLDIDKNEIIKMYDEENQAIEKPDYSLNENVIKSRKSSYFFLTPKKITIFFGVLLLILISAYLAYQFKFLIGPPNLAINLKGDIVINQQSIAINGKTDSGVYLTINGENVYVASDGSFSKEVQLASGANSIDIKAVNNFGKTTEIIRQVLRQ